VGFERNIRSAFVIVLLLCASGATAAPREPLLVTELHEPALVPLPGSDVPNEQSLDGATQRFSLALAQAIQSEQRTMEQACRSGLAAGASRSARYDWQAKCLYQRH
jgi:hypothetical protein